MVPEKGSHRLYHEFAEIVNSNKETQNNAIQYFSACIEKLEKFSPDTEIFIFFHKEDLVRKAKDYESRRTQLMELFQLSCTKKLKFFRTTIYKPETIIDALGRIFELTIPEAANSEFVDGKTIGEIEESLMVDIPSQEEPPEIAPSISTDPVSQKSAGI